MKLFKEEEIELAYDKLCNYYYYEKINIKTRAKVFKWTKSKIPILLSELNDSSNKLDKYLRQIKLLPYPKSFHQKEENDENNYFSNRADLSLEPVTNLLVFIDAPVEIHLISIIWVIRLGSVLDKSLRENCYGNRVYTNQYRPKQLFEKYHRKYKLWWHNALLTTQNLINKRSNATIFNLDIKSFYHSAEVDFKKLKEPLKKNLKDSGNYRIFNLLNSIHDSYHQVIKKHYPDVVTNREGKRAIPIGLLSSFVIANYYLKDLDDEILRTNPKYYGRYVDDIILVYKGISRAKSKNNISKFIKSKLSKILIENTKKENIKFVNTKYLNLEVQQKKLNLYEFSHKNSPSILTTLIEDQKKRSSEFRYLSDILDNNFEDFEGIVFESTFDFEEGNKAKFKDVNENKFKIAAYLSKLTKRIIDHGETYKKEEIKKVFKFFSGKYLIKHYYFWEKLLTLYSVSKKYKYFNKTINEISLNISELNLESEWNISHVELKKSLTDYLMEAKKLALSLDDKSKAGKNTVPRDHYSIYPFLPYTKAYLNKGVSLLEYNSLNRFKANPNLLKVNPNSVPIGKPFYWCYLSLFFYYTYSEKINSLNQLSLIKEAFLLYKEINRCDIKEEDVFEICKLSQNNSDSKSTYEIRGKIMESDVVNCRIAIVNEIVSDSNFMSSLLGKPIKSNKREAESRFELDQISKINNLEITVKPELAIPQHKIFDYVRHSSQYQYSLNSGIEYIPTKTYANNFILATLPIKVGKVFSDCLPIMRLKNDYSYEETKIIEKKTKLIVPYRRIKEFYLLRSNGIYFSNYYCFELTSIKNRSLFKSMIDLVVAPVWNKDNFYFKAISETFVRDLHCFYAQSNTSEFADSRLIQPTKSIHLVKSLVKGGTLPEPKINFSLLIDDIDLEKFRNFQLMKYNDTQKEKFKKKNIYKPLPPDYNKINVVRRIENLSMNISDSDMGDYNLTEIKNSQ